MKAIELQTYGGPDALHLVDHDRPKPDAGQILVQVAATSVNPLDINRASGALKAHFPLIFPFVPGGDFSGTVAGIGEGVDGFAVGGPVFGNAVEGGAYAEYIAVDAGKVATKPANLTDAEAASLALVGQTAMQAIDAAQLRDGQTLLVQGMGGAIGTIIAQLLRGRDVRVIGVASFRDRDRLLAQGVAEVIDREDRFEDRVGKVDAVIDGVGRDVQSRSWAVLKPGGVLVALNQPPSKEDAERHGARAVMLFTDTTRASLDRLRAAIEAGVVKPRFGRRYPLADTASAWANVSEDRAVGKTVIDVNAGSD